MISVWNHQLSHLGRTYKVLFPGGIRVSPEISEEGTTQFTTFCQTLERTSLAGLRCCCRADHSQYIYYKDGVGIL